MLLVLEEGSVVGPPSHDAAAGQAPVRTSERVQVDRCRAELDLYLREMQSFPSMEPDQVLLKLSGWGARAIEIRTHLVRNEGRLATVFRTKELDPFLAHLDFQFRVHSRIGSFREFDLKLTAGQT